MISTKKVKMIFCVCERCDHDWVTKKLPKYCPVCHSPYWPKKRRRDIRIRAGGRCIEKVAKLIKKQHIKSVGLKMGAF